MKHTRVCDLLGIEYPIVQAPMVWITGADLAAAVSNAGGLGIIGMNAGAKDVTTDVIETGERLRKQIRKMKQEGASAQEVSKFCYGADKFRPGLVNGDVDEFFIPLGAGASLITRVVSAEELVRDIANG